MKYTYTILFIAILLVFNACKSDKAQSDKKSTDQDLSFETFKSAFPTLDLEDTLHVHYWYWSNEVDSTYHGTKVKNDWLAQFVDTTKFKINPDEEYFALNHIEAINAYLIRITNRDYEYQQQIFALMYNDKNEITDRKKMAGFFGAPGFTNTAATWLVRSDSTIQMVMRNENWSMDVTTDTETRTDSIRYYNFEMDKFVAGETIGITKDLNKQFSLMQN